MLDDVTSRPGRPGRPQDVEREPFEVMVQRHGAAVLRVCRAVVGPDAAEDAWSETFLSALAGYPDLPPGSDVRAWLLTIAHRRAVDQARARARRPLPAAELPVGAVPHGARAARVPGGWEDDLVSLLATLPDKQRRAVAYHHLGGLPYAQVAELLGGTAEAARRAAADGVAALRRSYLPATSTSPATSTYGGPR
jgi:RNA polymerase sigma factor (sigma-70 family)